ncbi:putative LRR receptor-like serine/threonine-protein kinase, partial [Mucuna pruriens]
MGRGLEANQLSGDLPPELGKLTNIQRLLLSSNNFTGELPVTLAKLTALQDYFLLVSYPLTMQSNWGQSVFWEDTRFYKKLDRSPETRDSGERIKWANSFWNFTSQKFDRLVCMNMTFYVVSNDSNVICRRISDLKGSEHSPFPQLNNVKLLKTLILRSCNINGTLPSYLGTMAYLKYLDLSFNNLTGSIPSSSAALTRVDYIWSLSESRLRTRLVGRNLTGQEGFDYLGGL